MDCVVFTEAEEADRIACEWRGEIMQKRMMSAILLVLALFLTACGGKGGNSGIQVTDSITPAVMITDAPITDAPQPLTTITWQLAIIGGPSSASAKEINRLLLEKGYNCEIRFIRTGAYLPEMNRSWLENYEKENPPFDILNGGMWNDIYDQQEFLTELFVPITDYLASPQGSALANLISEYEWGAVSCKGDVYSIPAMLSTNSSDACTCLYVPERNIAYFESFDGSYASLKAIYEKNHRPEEKLIVGNCYALPALIGYQTYYGRIPYDASTHRLIDGTDSKKTEAYVRELLSDIGNGSLIWSDCETVNEEEAFAVIKGSRIQKEGYTVIPLLGTAGQFANCGLSYGISRKSTQKELALTIMSVCYTDPDIAALLLPEVNGHAGMQERKKLTEGLTFGELQGFVPELTEEQWRIFLGYPYGDAFTELFTRERDEKTGLETVGLNEQYDLSAELDALKDPLYTEILAEVNRQIERYLLEKE